MIEGRRAEEIVAGYRRSLERFERHDLGGLAAMIDAPQPQLPGLPARPSPQDVGEISGRNMLRLIAAREDVRRDALPRTQVQELLGVTSNQVSNLRSEKKLVALRGIGGERFPAWQFDLDADDPRLDGVRELTGAFSGGVVSLSQWAVRPNPALGGRSPAEALADGDVDLVVAVATHTA